jgi:hypothetical protein
MSAFVIDLMLIYFVAWGVFLFSTKNIPSMLILFRLGQPLLISWSVFIAIFVIGPLPCLVSFMMLSASPGQWLKKIREVDETTTVGPILIYQAFIHAYTIVPSALLGFLPQVFALFQEDQKTLVEFLIGTGTRSLTRSSQEQTPIWRASLISLMAGAVFIYGLKTIVPLMSLTRKGVLLSSGQGVLSQAVLQTPKPNRTPEDCFEAVKLALQKRDTQAALLQLTLQSQIMIAAVAQQGANIFEDLPEDVEFVRKEEVDSSTVKIYYHEMDRFGIVSPKEEMVPLRKENNEWKLDVSFLFKSKEKS